MKRTSLLLNDLKNFRDIEVNGGEIMQATGFRDPFIQKVIVVLAILVIIFLTLFANTM
jgi:hypothetical protein